MMTLYISDLNKDVPTLKRAMTNHAKGKESSNLTTINANGYYQLRAKVMVQGSFQNVDAISVTAPSNLPQWSQCDNLHPCIIIQIPALCCT